MEPLQKYFGENINDFYVSYTEIDKLGVNPQSRYSTPIGIYTYPMSFLHDNKGMANVPFAGESPNLFVVKPKVPVLVLNDYDNLDNDIAKIDVYLKKNYPDANSASLINGAISSARDVKNMNASRMWNICRRVANHIAEDQSTTKFNYLLRVVLGYSVVRDDGMGLIHPAEPNQAVFLSKDALQIVEQIKNTHENYNTIQQETLRRLSDVCKKNDITLFKTSPRDNGSVYITQNGQANAHGFRIPVPLDDNMTVERFKITNVGDSDDDLLNFNITLNKRLNLPRLLLLYDNLINKFVAAKQVSDPTSVDVLCKAVAMGFDHYELHRLTLAHKSPEKSRLDKMIQILADNPFRVFVLKFFPVQLKKAISDIL